MKTIQSHKWFYIFLIIYFSIILFKLITKPLPFFDWDEAIYMQVGKEMIEKKSLIPLWQDKFWLDKPPLVMLLYGIIPKLFFFITPEISARIFNVFLNLIYLILIYFFVIKVTRSKAVALLTTIITSLTPLFIQRVFTVNMDVFLGIGWLGYFLFYPNFYLSTFFLSFAIFSKSLLGFYPIFLLFGYFLILFFIKKISQQKLFNNLKFLILQFFIFFLWYFFMFLKFGHDFLYQHIYESHFKRITASIEFHFGERVFYFTELIKQFNYFSILSFAGLFIIIYKFYRKKILISNFFYFNLFFPWFIFLNITKTKIFWYLYPVLPQFSFYLAYFFDQLINQKKLIKIKKLLIFIFLWLVFYWIFFVNKFHTAKFSQYDKFYYFSQFAKNHCQKIYFLPENSHRKAINELEKMNLTITTTKWWGGHPSLVYYTNNKIKFFYDEMKFIRTIKQKSKNDCFAYFNNENLIFDQNKVKLLKQFEDFYLFK